MKYKIVCQLNNRFLLSWESLTKAEAESMINETHISCLEDRNEIRYVTENSITFVDELGNVIKYFTALEG